MGFGMGRTTVASAEVVLTANTKQMTDGLKKAEGQLSSTASKGSKSTSKLGLGLGTLAKGAGMLGVGFAAMKGAHAIWDDFLQGQAGAAQTAATLKSTGNAAHVTAKEVGSLASAIQAKSGMDDDAVASGENLLLTFTKIRNEQGKGNDIFNQATKTMADLSVAFGQDTKSSAIQLGKALNDPVKGMTALSRVGVSFTAGQAKTIKSMVAHNNVLGAQKMMLKVVNEQVGGSAAAYGKTLPGMIDRAKQATLSFASDGLAKLVPYITEAANAVIKFTQSKQFQEWMATAKEAAKLFLEDVRIVFNLLRPIVEPVLKFIIADLHRVANVVADVARIINAVLHGKWGEAWHYVKQLVGDVIAVIVGRVKGMGGLLMQALGAIAGGIVGKAKDLGSALKNGIMGAISGLPAAMGGLVRSGVNAAIDAVNSGLQAIADNWPDVPGAPGPPGFLTNGIGHVAFGGPVRGGRPYVVGETGPELVIPGGDSYVVNSPALKKMMGNSGGGGGVVQVIIQSLHPADADTLRQVAAYVNRGQDLVNSGRLYSPIQRPGL